MKVRHGFVSNSSSSSFIVGIAEIVDKEKFDEYVKGHKIALDQYSVFITGTGSKNWEVRRTEDKISVDGFAATVSAKVTSPSAIYLAVNISNDEGDYGRFSYDDRLGEIDYNIDADYFDADQRKVYDMFFDRDSGLSMENDIQFGAARNG